MNSKLLFSLLARRKLRQRTTRAAAKAPDALRKAMDDIESTLAVVFPSGSTAILQDVYVSYRIRPGEYILLVELTDSGEQDGLYVVKIGDDEQRLRRELDGWTACKPHGLRHDLVLTSLEPHYDVNGKLIALVYADADQIIGVDQTLSLEQAMLDCVLLGSPSAESIAECLFVLYERLGLLLYRDSYTEEPTEPDVCIERIDRRLPENLERLKHESNLRSTVLTATENSGFQEAFIPPGDFATAVLADLAGSVPRLLRGHAHGDLHGRNVLVGRIADRVVWPAVFDYGDMGVDNLIGWDFVKLETEFKIRAYPEIFKTRQLTYLSDVIRTEVELHEQTANCREESRWPLAPAENTPLARLKWLILMIRKHAANHLGIYRVRSREWLAEHHFLLAIYGLNGIRFENLTEVQRMAGYAAAGVAAARYYYDK